MSQVWGHGADELGMLQEPSPRDPRRGQFYEMLGDFPGENNVCGDADPDEFTDLIESLIPGSDLDELVGRVRRAWGACVVNRASGVVERSFAVFRHTLDFRPPSKRSKPHQGGYRAISE